MSTQHGTWRTHVISFFASPSRCVVPVARTDTLRLSSGAVRNSATANGIVMNGFQGGEEKPSNKGHSGMYLSQPQSRPSGAQAGGAALMALSMQQHPGSLPRPMLSNGGELLVHPAHDRATD